MTNLIDTQLGQYRLVEIVRRGGMSIVYKAYQESLDRFVAVKVLSSNRDPQFATRFKREARASATLQHHNILQIYDYGEQDDLLYLVMQYIENGVTLGDMLDQPLEPIVALRLISHVLDALDYAHKRGVIHRDIKPANVLMPTPTWPMLADFGIAKLLNDTREQLTMANQIIGTAAYMSPEQATGRPIDVRTDLYSAGVVLYELLTGRVPFEADSPVAVLSKHVYETPPPPRSINPDLPPAADALLARALAKNPAARYQSAAEMSSALLGLIGQLDRDVSRSQVTGLYESGVQAFEEGHWDVAVERLGKLAELNPDYEDVTDLLAAAHEEQERARVEARQRIEQVRQRRQSTMQQPLHAPPADAMDANPAPAESAVATNRVPLLDDTSAETPANASGQTTPADAPVPLAAVDAADAPVPASAANSTNNVHASSATMRLDIDEHEVAAPPASAARPTEHAPMPVPAAPVADSETVMRPGEQAGRTRRPIPLIMAAAVVILLLGALAVWRPWQRLGAGPAQLAAAATTATEPNAAVNPTTGAASLANTSATAPTDSAVVPASTPVPTAAPMPNPAGSLVYEDDFNAGAARNGLEDLTTATDFQRGFHDPGVYHIRIMEPNTTRTELFPRHLYHNFNMQIELWDNSDNLLGDVAQGLIFRARDTTHFYALFLDPRKGQYRISKQDGENTWTDLIAWKDSALIKRQADHNLVRVDGDDATFTIYLNGTMLDSFKDDSYSAGMLGMIVANVDADMPHMHFDNLHVWSTDAVSASSFPAQRTDPHGDMVLIPGGEFIMGSNEKSDEFPNVVKLNDFYIDHTEVTNAVYAQCVAAKQCPPPKSPDSKTHTNYAADPQFANFPVIDVSWQQANTFCGWAGKRLPTEAEWEKAASWKPDTDEKMVWPWGDDFDPTRLNSAEANIGDTSKVGQFPPELNNTVDMGGNVYEWTSSLAQPYPYKADDGREDPQADGDRIFRGGSWAQTQGKARTTSRQSAPLTYSGRETGFRCASDAKDSGQVVNSMQGIVARGAGGGSPANDFLVSATFMLSTSLAARIKSLMKNQDL
jgi:formylglycine-generating enzyme required for sulfatase activity/tRNA A-37 threonylcarbamoyl transferase component Bud32